MVRSPPDPERAKQLAAEAARRSESLEVPAAGLAHAMEAFRESLREKGLYAVLPFLLPLRDQLRARTSRLRSQLACLPAAGCAGTPAAAANLLAVAAVAGALGAGTLFALPVIAPDEHFAIVPVASRIPIAQGVPQSSASAPADRAPVVRTKALIASSFEVRPGPAPARAGGSVTTDRRIGVGINRSFSADGENNTVVIDHYLWIYCDPQSQVKQALCGAYDTASAMQGSSQER